MSQRPATCIRPKTIEKENRSSALKVTTEEKKNQDRWRRSRGSVAEGGREAERATNAHVD